MILLNILLFYNVGILLFFFTKYAFFNSDFISNSNSTSLTIQ